MVLTQPDIPLFLRDLMGAKSLKVSGYSAARGFLRRGLGCSHRGFMLTGGVQVAEIGEFCHTDLGNRHFGGI